MPAKSRSLIHEEKYIKINEYMTLESRKTYSWAACSANNEKLRSSKAHNARSNTHTHTRCIRLLRFAPNEFRNEKIWTFIVFFFWFVFVLDCKYRIRGSTSAFTRRLCRFGKYPNLHMFEIFMKHLTNKKCDDTRERYMGKVTVWFLAVFVCSVDWRWRGMGYRGVVLVRFLDIGRMFDAKFYSHHLIVYSRSPTVSSHQPHKI